MNREDYDKAIETLKADPRRILVKLSRIEAWALIQAIQVAWRVNSSGPIPLAKDVALILEKEVAKDPILKAVAEKGWDADEKG